MSNNKKSEGLFQELAMKLNEIIPVKWDKILLNAEVKEGMTSIYYVFFESESKQLKDLSSLTKEFGLDRKQYRNSTVELSLIVSRLNEGFIEEGKEKWTTMTFILTNDGKFKVDFGYEDLEASDVVERRESWESKYL